MPKEHVGEQHGSCVKCFWDSGNHCSSTCESCMVACYIGSSFYLCTISAIWQQFVSLKVLSHSFQLPTQLLNGCRRIHWIEDWVDSKANVNAVVTRKTFAYTENWILVIQPVNYFTDWFVPLISWNDFFVLVCLCNYDPVLKHKAILV